MDWLALMHKPCAMTVIITNYSHRFYSRGGGYLGAKYIPPLCDQAFCCRFHHMITQTYKSCNCGTV